MSWALWREFRMHNLVRRYLYFLLGLAINSFGIAFITKSALGTSQISSVPYVFSLQFTQFSFGGWSFIMNMAYIFLQIAILRKKFQPIQLLQIAVNVLFSSFIDVGILLLQWFNPVSWPLRLASLAIGCVILAIGISIEVAPGVVVVPGEGIVRTISQVKGWDFGVVKIAFDLTLICIALIFSLLFFHGLRGLGLGTLISALTVGKLVSVVNHKFPLIDHIRKLAVVPAE